MAEPVIQRLTGYEVLSTLGQGGMGVVFKARDTALERIVALKVLASHLAADPDYLTRFKREAIAAAGLSHPNIVHVYAAGEDSGVHFFAMEFVDGESLQKRLNRHSRLDPEEAVAVCVYVAQALDYAWKKAQIIHRDVKPDNIFLTNDGQVKLGDLGLAKRVKGSSTSASLTQTGMTLGTPHYISPEQARGRKDLDFRADIYSLGCTLYRMLSGKTPYEGDEGVEVILHHVNDPPPDIRRTLPACPSPLVALLARMMAKNPNTRYASYAELIAELQRVAGQLKGGVPAVQAAAKPTEPRRPRTARYAALAAVVVVAAAAWVMWPPWKPAADSKPPTKAEEKPSAPKQPSSPPAETPKVPEIGGKPTVPTPPPAPPPPAVPATTIPTAAQPGQPLMTSIGMELVFIPPGKFMMGSTPEERVWAESKEAGGKKTPDNEGNEPRRAVVRSGFWLGRTEVSVGQWKQFVNATGYRTDAEKQGSALGYNREKQWGATQDLSWRNPIDFVATDDCPAGCISWNDAVAFCEWLDKTERTAGRLPSGYMIRLPTEAEWEYACRGGLQGKRFWWGDEIKDGMGRENWSGTWLKDGFESASPVGRYGANGRNGFGLSDMLGNMFELCLDGYDPAGAHAELFTGDTSSRVMKGASFREVAGFHRCANRFKTNPSGASLGSGFRVCCGVDAASASFSASSAAPSMPQIAQPAAGPSSATKDQSWTNSLGMKFVPLPGTTVLFSIWETRVQDFETFVKATGYDCSSEMSSLRSNGWKKRGDSWRSPGFVQGPTHPVVGVNWKDGKAFCQWLTEKEQREGQLAAQQSYRLPNEAEWAKAVGSSKYPWGDQWPPPSGAGNYAGEESKTADTPSDQKVISGYSDGYARTAPVGSFKSNQFGLYDSGGNVWEWGEDWYRKEMNTEEACQRFSGLRKDDGGQTYRVLLGAAWYISDPILITAGFRDLCPPDTRCDRNGFRVVLVTGESASGAGPQRDVSSRTTPAIAQSGQPLMTSIGMELVWIPPGEFTMGSTLEERAWAVANGCFDKFAKREGGEAQRKIRMEQGFWLGKTEVTFGQWKPFVAATGYVTEAEKSGGSHTCVTPGGKTWGWVNGANWKDPNYGFKLLDNHPVSCISWNDAVAFCAWLSECEQKAGRLPTGFKIRLPTEAEWEYACRAGTQTKFWWGDAKEGADSRLNYKGNQDGFEFISPVDHYGARGRNGLGLADMLGNLWEWCLDKRDEMLAQEEPSKGKSHFRMLRGGAYVDSLGITRCANKHGDAAGSRSSRYGFRVCCGVDVANTSVSTSGNALIPQTPPTQSPKVSDEDTRRAAQLVRDYRNGLVFFEGPSGFGSGFIVEIKGRVFLLSNAHVVAGIKNAVFKLLDRTLVRIGPASVAIGHDMMVIYVLAGGTPLPKMESVDKEAAIGDAVVVLGNAEGGGVINTLVGKLIGIGPDRIEVDAPFQPGNSGSPIIHLPSGKVIGIATYAIMKQVGDRQEVARRFGYRLDSVDQWQVIDWNRFYTEADMMKGIETATRELNAAFDELGRKGKGGNLYDTPAIRFALDAFRRSKRAPQDYAAVLSSLRTACVYDVQQAEARLTYDYFKRKLAAEKRDRDYLATLLDKILQR